MLSAAAMVIRLKAAPVLRPLKAVGAMLLSTGRQADALQQRLNGMDASKFSQGVSRGLKTIATAGALALSAVTALSAANFTGFEARMSGVEAVTQSNAQAMDALTAKARDLGESTVFAASQAGEGMEYLGRAGFDTQAILGSIGPSLDLAAAGALGLGQSADIMSNVMSTWNMHTSESSRVADVMAAASASANTNVQQLGDAFKFVGPVAAALKRPIEETAAAVGVLSDRGIQGEMAGTGLRRIYQGLVAPTKKARGALAKYGLTVADVNPETHSLVDILGKLKNVTTEDAFTLFAQRGGTAFLALRSGAQDVAKLHGELDKANGTAERMAKTMTDNLHGSVMALKSAAESTTIELGQGMSPALRGATDEWTDFLRSNREATAHLGERLGGALGLASDALLLVAENASLVKAALAVLMALAFYGAVTKWAAGLKAAAGAMKIFGAALGPVTLAITALVAAASLADSAISKWSVRSTKAIEEIVSSGAELRDLGGRVDELLEKGSQKDIEVELGQLNNRLKEVQKELDSSTQRVDRWRAALVTAQQAGNASSQELAHMRTQIEQAAQAKGVAWKTAEELDNAITALTERYKELKGATDEETEALELLKAEMKAANGELDEGEAKARAAEKAQQKLAQTYESMAGSLASQIEQEESRLKVVGASAAAQLEAAKKLAIFNAEQKLGAEASNEYIVNIRGQIEVLFNLRKAISDAEAAEEKRRATQALLTGSEEALAQAQERLRVAAEEGMEALRRYDIYLEIRNEASAKGLDLTQEQIDLLVDQRLETERLTEETETLVEAMEQNPGGFWQQWGEAASEALSNTGNALSQLLDQQLTEWIDFGDSIAANLGEALLRELTSQAIRSAVASIFSGSGSGGGFWSSLLNGFLGSSGGGGVDWGGLASSAYSAYQGGGGLGSFFGGSSSAASSGAVTQSYESFSAMQGGATSAFATAAVVGAIVAAIDAWKSAEYAKRFDGLGMDLYYGTRNVGTHQSGYQEVPTIYGRGDTKFDPTLADEIGRQVEDVIFGIVEAVGGTIESLQTIKIKANNAGDQFKLIVGEYEQTFDSLDEALRAGMEEMLAGGVITGVTDNVAAVLDRVDQIGLDGLQGALDLALEADSALASQLGNTGTALARASGGLSDYERGLNEATSAAEDAVRTGRELGLTEESLAALRAQRIEQYEQEFEALQKGAQSKFLQGIMEILGEDHATYMELVQLEGHLKILDLRRQLDLMYTMGGLADETLARYEALLARAEGAVTSGRYRGRSSGSAGRGQSRAAEAAQLERQRQNFRDALNQVQRDLGETAAGLVDALVDLGTQRDEILGLGMGAEFADDFVRANAREAVDAFLEPFREIRRAAGESDGETTYRQLRERYDTQIEAAHAANAALNELQGGGKREQHLAELLEPILAAMEIELVAFGEDVINGLGLPLEQARDQASGLGDQVALLTRLMEDGVISLERYEGVMGELSQQAEVSLLGMAAEIQERLGNSEEAQELRAQIDRVSFELKVAELQILYEQYSALGLIREETGALLDGLLGTLAETDLEALFKAPETPRLAGPRSTGGSNTVEEREREIERIRQALAAWREAPLHSLVREARQMTAEVAELRSAASILPGGNVLLAEIDEAWEQGVASFVDNALERYEGLGESDLVRDERRIIEDFNAMRQAFDELGANAEARARLAIAEANAWDDFWQRGTSGLQAFLDELNAADPRVSGEERFLEAQATFRDLRARAAEGDLGALEQLADAARAYNTAARDYLGGGVGTHAVLDELGSVRELIDSNPYVDDTTAAIKDGNVILGDILDAVKAGPSIKAELDPAALEPFRPRDLSLDLQSERLAASAFARVAGPPTITVHPPEPTAFAPPPESKKSERHLAALAEYADRQDRREQRREQDRDRPQRRSEEKRRPQPKPDPTVELLTRILHAIENGGNHGGYRT